MAHQTTKKEVILLGMLAFIPLSMVAEWLNLNPGLVFVAAGLAIIPLAARIAHSTEGIAEVIGPTMGEIGRAHV